MVANTQRGLQRVVAELGVKAEVDTSAVSPSIPDPGWDKVGEAGARVFSGISAKVGQWADKAAAVEGDLQGQLDALNPEFRPRNDMTIRGQSYDRAGLEIWERRVSMQIGKDVDAAKVAANGDPVVLKDVLSKQQKSFIASLPPQSRASAQLQFEREHFTAMREAARQKQAETIAAHREAVLGDIEQRVARIHQKAYGLGLDEKADEIHAAEIAELRRIAATKGVDGKPLIPLDAQRQLEKKVLGHVTEAKLLGAFERNATTPEAKEQFIKELDDEFASSGPIVSRLNLDGYLSIRSKLQTGLSRARTEENAATEQLRHDLKRFEDQARQGIPLKPDEEKRLDFRIIESGAKPEHQAWLSQSKQRLSMTQAFMGMPTDQQEAILAERRQKMLAGGASAFDIQVTEDLEKLYARSKELAAHDKLGLLQTQRGIVVAPIDVDNPQAVVEGLRSRVGLAVQAQAELGGDYHFFRPQERDRLAGKIRMGGAEMIAMAGAIHEGLGQYASVAFREFEKQAPGFVAMGALVRNDGSAHVVDDAAKWYHLRARGTPGRLKSDVQAFTEFSKLVGPAMSLSPGAMQSFFDLTKAAYETRAERANLQEFDTDLFRRTAIEATGQVTAGGKAYGGLGKARNGWFDGSAYTTWVPRGVQSDRFDDLLGAIGPEQQAKIGPGLGDDGKPLRWQTIVGSHWISIGEGKYRVNRNSDPENPGAVLDENGRPKVFDLNPIMPELRRRAPDLFIGYAGEPAMRPEISPKPVAADSPALRDTEFRLEDTPLRRLLGNLFAEVATEKDPKRRTTPALDGGIVDRAGVIDTRPKD